ncbi:MAG TPA: 30S ribosomal protein S2 [Candidatus Babeliales bacterium]|jgi:small subunit ribosomal protein S2|nr:30S ribosomal protein S2 [Candidatus Babeliales bacterium]
MRDFKELFGELVKAGVHFGHQKSRWCPKMEQYIWGYKNKVHLIDVSKTAFQLDKSEKFLESIAAEGKTILWVGTKKAASKTIQDIAVKLNQPYVNHRWLGGTLLNFSQVKKSLTRLLHYEDILLKSESNPFYTKKELNLYRKTADKLEKTVGGIRKLALPVGAIVIVDVSKEQSAVKEAVLMGIPVIGIVDTNSDPSLVDFVIPANDDSVQAVSLILNYLAEAVVRGREIGAKKSKDAADAQVGKKGAKEQVVVEQEAPSDVEIALQQLAAQE